MSLDVKTIRVSSSNLACAGGGGGGGGGKILLQYTETVLKYDWPRNKDSYLKVPELGQVNLE